MSGYSHHVCVCTILYVAGHGQQLSKTHETYLISAESAQDADDWVAAIRRVMHEVGVPLFHMSVFKIRVVLCSHMVEECLAAVWKRHWKWSQDLEEATSPSSYTAVSHSSINMVCTTLPFLY